MRIEDLDTPLQDEPDPEIERQWRHHQASLQVSEELRHIYFAPLDAEGWHHVDGKYHASIDDADIERRRLAERILRDQVRIDQWHARNGIPDDAVKSLNILVA